VDWIGTALESSCECGNEPTSSTKGCKVLVASRVVFSSIQVVSSVSALCDITHKPRKNKKSSLRNLTFQGPALYIRRARMSLLRSLAHQWLSAMQWPTHNNSIIRLCREVTTVSWVEIYICRHMTPHIVTFFPTKMLQGDRRVVVFSEVCSLFIS
jgi:hypothetical protein